MAEAPESAPTDLPEEPPVAEAPAPDRTDRPRRTAASTGPVNNTVLLMTIVAAFLTVMGTAVGIPLYVMDGNIRELGDRIDALAEDLAELKDELRGNEVEMVARFAEQDAKFYAKLASLEDKMDARFADQDAKFDAKLTALEDKMDARFADQDVKLAALEDKMDARFAEHDARFATLEKGQTEIDRKLTALIAHLQATEAVETALEGSFG